MLFPSSSIVSISSFRLSRNPSRLLGFSAPTCPAFPMNRAEAIVSNWNQAPGRIRAPCVGLVPLAPPPMGLTFTVQPMRSASIRRAAIRSSAAQFTARCCGPSPVTSPSFGLTSGTMGQPWGHRSAGASSGTGLSRASTRTACACSSFR